MQRTIPLFITSIHDPGGVARRGAVANLSEIVSITNESPAKIYKAAEERYQGLLKELRPIISKEKLSNEDRASIGAIVNRFQDELGGFSPSYGLEVVNLRQAVAEDLGKDVNTIEAYLIYAKARREKPNLPEGRPHDIIIETLKSSPRPMTPSQISASCGVNYNTVRRVVQELLRDGQISRGTGRGTYAIK
ncbi:MAG TPA: helix-turn-helix domain-containing protein [Nitrososphaerales archaeon]|nr:helix-turn-helix domain-containing protein [Nitrososphaerales archaeon]